jgi:hypothetical protein
MTKPNAVILLVLSLPGLAAAQPSQQSCVDVAVGSAQSYSCLNQQLGAAARQAHDASSGSPPYDATSPSNVTGQFNESATRTRLGKNFGHSVTPQRPPPANPAPFGPHG